MRKLPYKSAFPGILDSMKNPFHGLLSLFLVTFAMIAPASATWSIIITNTTTGEVVAASATCIPNLDILAVVPVVRVGLGGAAAQSMGDTGAVNRKKIWNKFANGVRPNTMINDLAAGDPWHKYRQYGIVDFANSPATFTGSGAGAAKKGVTGVVGELRYSIQGNVLTDPIVIDAAETALLTSTGDMGQRVMAAMEAARALGGDGRCSCSPTAPTSCGAPPPGFTKSAHIGFLVIARHGDMDGVCTGPLGCANGNYYLTLNVSAGSAAPDPILTLAADHAAWRAGLSGHPDHVKTRVTQGASRLPADGITSTTVFIELRDVDDVAITTGGATLALTQTSSALTQLGPITDYGNGSYSFDVMAGSISGTETIDVRVDDGTVQATLFPPVTIEVDPKAALHAGETELSASATSEIPFTLNFGPSAATSAYFLLGSLSGTIPGTPLGSQILPLNWDALSLYTLTQPGAPLLPGSFGLLDANGRATASLAAPAGTLVAFAGLHLDWASIALTLPESLSNPVGLDITP